MTPRVILVIRHAETEWSRADRVQGWAPVALTDAGHERAEALGRHLTRDYDLDAVVASDLRRAVETAAHITSDGEDAVETRTGWRERDFGIYQGMDDDVFADRFPRFSYGTVGERAFGETPEGGESWYDVRDRVSDAWDALIAETSGDVAVVTHTGVLGCLVSLLTGKELDEAFAPGFDYCGITTVAVTRDDDAAGDDAGAGVAPNAGGDAVDADCELLAVDDTGFRELQGIHG